MGTFLKLALFLVLIPTRAAAAYSPYTEIQVGGSAIDPRVIRALTTSDAITASQGGTWSVGRTWTLGAGTDTVVANQGGTWNLGNITGTISLPTGASSETTLSNFSAKFTAFDADTGAGVQMLQGVLLKKPGSGGGADFGTSTDPIRTDPTGATTQPISGAVSVSNFPASQAVTLASIPLASGAATAAKQPALGTAGSASADVISIQGVASMTPVKVDGSATTQPVSGSVSITGTPSVNATLAAETTKVIGTVNLSAGQSITVTQATGSNLNATVSGSVSVSNFPSGAAQDATLTGGTAKVQIATSTKATYWASNGTTAYTPPAAATDMIQIQGSASKTIRVLDFVVCASATAAGAQTVYLVKRSTANSGGTATLPTLAPLDSSNSAATAIVRQYSAVATSLGTVVGTPRARRMFFQITAGTAVIEPCTNLLAYVSDNVIGQPFTLRGTAESLSLNNNAATLAAGYKIDSYYIVWTEE